MSSFKPLEAEDRLPGGVSGKPSRWQRAGRRGGASGHLWHSTRREQDYRTARREQREARHILVELPRDAEDAAAESAAKEKIDALRERVIEGGEDFAEVAKEANRTIQARPACRRLASGYFGRGVMDPAFEEAAYSLDQGVVSEPVRSSFGWHLIEVTECIQDRADPRTFDEVQGYHRVRSTGTGQAEQLYAERVDELGESRFRESGVPGSGRDRTITGGRTVHHGVSFARSGEGASGVALDSSGSGRRHSPVAVLDDGVQQLNYCELGRRAGWQWCVWPIVQRIAGP